jgi:hypothetical protein
MTKTINKVKIITEKALSNPEKIYKCPNYTADVDTIEGQRVFHLTHYGTIILRYDLYTNEIIELGGAFSQSDRDAINTSLDVINHTSLERTYIRKGELQLSKN